MYTTDWDFEDLSHRAAQIEETFSAGLMTEDEALSNAYALCFNFRHEVGQLLDDLRRGTIGKDDFVRFLTKRMEICRLPEADRIIDIDDIMNPQIGPPTYCPSAYDASSIDNFRGCLIGGAIGDALGYAVEFLSYRQITERYGAAGITEYDPVDGVAQISDDTQMTLFTANGILNMETACRLHPYHPNYASSVACSYGDWLMTQGEAANPFAREHYLHSWLLNIPGLHASRAPGTTFLTALLSGQWGSVRDPINNSEGCGGVMRIAPVGLYLGKHLHARGDTYDINSREWIIENAAEIAAITHGQDLGYIPAAAQALIIDAIIYGSYSGENDLYEIISGSVRNVCRVFKDSLHISEFEQLMAKAISLATGKTGDLTCISELGQGWTGDEALAIAIFCALRYKRDFEKAITTSVNHDGDSDSTGSLTGNILGAYHGFNALPQHFIEDLELKDIILEIADDLYCDCEPKNRWFSYEAFVDTAWSHKYHLRDYPNVI